MSKAAFATVAATALLLLGILPATSSARSRGPAAACTGYARLWDQAVKSGDEVLLLERRSEAELLRSQCPDLLHRIDTYYPRDAVHQLAERLIDGQFERSSRMATDPSGLIYYGYDIVALVDNDEVVQGDFANAALHQGAIFLFADQESLARFQSSPDKYKIEYGGYCAYCLAIDHIVGGRWDALDRHNGKIYAFSAEQNKVVWLKKRRSYMAKADRTWAKTDWTQEQVGFSESDMGKLLIAAVSDVERARNAKR